MKINTFTILSIIVTFSLFFSCSTIGPNISDNHILEMTYAITYNSKDEEISRFAYTHDQRKTEFIIFRDELNMHQTTIIKNNRIKKILYFNNEDQLIIEMIYNYNTHGNLKNVIQLGP